MPLSVTGEPVLPNKLTLFGRPLKGEFGKTKAIVSHRPTIL